MNIRIIFLMMLLIILPRNAFGVAGNYKGCYYETGDGISLSVSGQVSVEADKTMFSYAYTVKSNPQSEQAVWLFKIIFPEKDIVDSSSAPLGWKAPGWAKKLSKYSHLIEKKPPYWIAWTTPDEKDILPSELVAGFGFKTSFGLPGIVDYYSEGNATMKLMCKEELEEDFIPGYHDLTPYGPGIVGKTIGPKPIPADFKSVDFVDYMISMKHEASSLGWITNKGVENSLDAKLDNAKEKIEQGNFTVAKNILNAFLNEVEAQNGKHLTSEAYALLKYNVQYLLERI